MDMWQGEDTWWDEEEKKGSGMEGTCSGGISIRAGWASVNKHATQDDDRITCLIMAAGQRSRFEKGTYLFLLGADLK